MVKTLVYRRKQSTALWVTRFNMFMFQTCKPSSVCWTETQTQTPDTHWATNSKLPALISSNNMMKKLMYKMYFIISVILTETISFVSLRFQTRFSLCVLSDPPSVFLSRGFKVSVFVFYFSPEMEACSWHTLYKAVRCCCKSCCSNR